MGLKKNNPEVVAERTCKKCGDPLRSTSKYNYCDNCRRERAKVRKELGGTFLALSGMVISCIPVVKYFKKK